MNEMNKRKINYNSIIEVIVSTFVSGVEPAGTSFAEIVIPRVLLELIKVDIGLV